MLGAGPCARGRTRADASSDALGGDHTMSEPLFKDLFFSSKFDKDFTLVFAQLLGLKSATISSPNDFKPLADALPNTLTGVKLTFE